MGDITFQILLARVVHGLLLEKKIGQSQSCYCHFESSVEREVPFQVM